MQDPTPLSERRMLRWPSTLAPYFLAGAVAATVDWLLFYVFAVRIGWPYLWVSAFGFVVATLVNYVLCITVVFKHNRQSTPMVEVVLIFLVSGSGLLLHQFIIYYAISIREIDMMLAKIVATGMIFFWNYTLRRFVIFPR